MHNACENKLDSHQLAHVCMRQISGPTGSSFERGLLLKGRIRSSEELTPHPPLKEEAKKMVGLLPL